MALIGSKCYLERILVESITAIILLLCDMNRFSMFLILRSVAFLVTLLPNSSFHLWLGLTSDSQGHFKWAEPGLLSYTNWGPGEPVNNSGQNKNPV